MKKLFLLLSFSLISSHVLADWEYFAGNSSNTFYVDLSTRKVANGFVRVWTLNDYASPSKGELSAKNYLEIDCKDERYRFLSINTFGSNMGKGEVLQSSNSKSDWIYVVPNSSINLLVQKVCR